MLVKNVPDIRKILHSGCLLELSPCIGGPQTLPNLDVTFKDPVVMSLLEGDVAVGFCTVVPFSFMREFSSFVYRNSKTWRRHGVELFLPTSFWFCFPCGFTFGYHICLTRWAWGTQESIFKPKNPCKIPLGEGVGSFVTPWLCAPASSLCG